jgi:tetratricopeptide (TPR) repeat protein
MMSSTPKKSGRSQDKDASLPPSRPRFPVWKKALFSILTLAFFFGLTELILFIAGVKPLSYEEDPYVGFSSQIPLFIEQESDNSQMVTSRNKLSFFNKQSFPKAKKDHTTRIFCVGGSTTYGRPYDDTTSFSGWLRELLPVADSSNDWELINAGGISYASYRVAALMEELAQYEPDVFIVYCGQNEFLERRTYSGIIDMPASIRGLGAVLSRTRTYSGIARLVRNSSNKTDDAPEKLDGEVNAILDQSVGPQDYQRNEELESQVLAHYRYNMARIVDIARSSGARILFVSPASNLRNCTPFKSQNRDGLDGGQKQQWEALMESARARIETKDFTGALTDLDHALEIDDQYALSHYLRGRVLEGLEKFDDAKEAYQKALDEDVCPLRALSSMPGIVSEVAHDRDVPVIDFATMVEEGSPNGIPGEELFLDHVHPTINGHRMLALAIVDEMKARDWLSTGSDWNDAAIEKVAAGIMKKVDPKQQGIAMRNLSKVYSWAGKMEDAYRAARKALELFPGDAETHYQIGNLARQLGKTDEAIERLEHLVSVNLKPEISYYLKAHLQLSEILAERGDYLKSEQVVQKLLKLDPANSPGKEQRVRVMSQYGRQLIKDGLPAEAARKFGEVTRLQPDNFDAKVQHGVALVRAGDYSAAAAVLESIIELRPDYLPGYDNLSFVLAQLGRLDDAEKACLQALKIDPNHEAARKNLTIIQKRKAAGN